MEEVMYKACIFDLDGTLTDTLESLNYSVGETMKEVGLSPITKEQCREFVGNGAKVLIEKALKASGDEKLSRFDEAFAAYQRIFDENCTYQVRPYRGILQMLAELKSLGVKLGVLSNKPDKQTVYVVSEIFGRDMFDLVQGQKEGVPRKPDPAALLSMAEHFGAEPSETLYVGDSEVDAATGKGARMDTILVSWGFRDRETLAAAGAVKIADNTEEILEIVRNRGMNNV